MNATALAGSPPPARAAGGAAAGTRSRPAPEAGSRQGPRQLLDSWLAVQAINLTRHVRSLRPFRLGEFGTGPAAPSEAHLEAVNRFLDGFRGRLDEAARWVTAAADEARLHPDPARLDRLLVRKQQMGMQVLYVEGIWDFYFDLFVQRLSSFGDYLRTVDRIAASCYEDLYAALGTARPTPRLLPFSYATTGFSPATYRRGVPLRRLRLHPNLFPLITLPQHRLENPWALSSVLHEVSHNLQADLGLWNVMPKLIQARLTGDGGLPAEIADTWARWHKETMADMLALLLGGPAAVESLMDVVARGRRSTTAFNPAGVHPTPYLRVPISLELLRRLGLPTLARDLGQVWRRLYPGVGPSEIPEPLLRTFPRAVRLVVDTMVFRPLPGLGGRPLADLLRFGPEQVALVRVAGERLAGGEDPGTVPLRFMVGAARFALDRRLAPPQTLSDNFYRTLGRR
jgi:hypothetical protein